MARKPKHKKLEQQQQVAQRQQELATFQVPYDVWWLIYSATHKLSQSLKEPVRKHMIARGFYAQKDWDAGIKDFGF